MADRWTQSEYTTNTKKKITAMKGDSLQQVNLEGLSLTLLFSSYITAKHRPTLLYWGHHTPPPCHDCTTFVWNSPDKRYCPKGGALSYYFWEDWTELNALEIVFFFREREREKSRPDVREKFISECSKVNISNMMDRR